jgi:hypothetical protein
MNISVLIAGIVLGAALVVILWYVVERGRSARLRRRFGPEYERVLRSTGSQRAAEAELHERERRVRSLEIRRLLPADRDRFASRWREVQTRFVDEPGEAVEQADRLVSEVMSARGYPMADFEQRAADVSVDHPQVVDHYRTAHRIGGRRNGAATDTEELRQAMVHYRALFSELLETDDRAARAREPVHEAQEPGRQRQVEPATRSSADESARANAPREETAGPGASQAEPAQTARRTR